MLKTHNCVTGWVCGQIGPYRYEAQVFDEPSRYGINGGRTPLLLIRSDGGSWLVNYDRGWDLPPTDDELVVLVGQVLYEVEGEPGDG